MWQSGVVNLRGYKYAESKFGEVVVADSTRGALKPNVRAKWQRMTASKASQEPLTERICAELGVVIRRNICDFLFLLLSAKVRTKQMLPFLAARTSLQLEWALAA